MTTGIVKNDGITKAHINLQHASEHAAILFWHACDPSAAERHRGYMLEHLKKVADALECDLIEREQKVVPIRGAGGEAA